MTRRFFFARFAWYVLATFAVATPVTFYGAAKAVRSNSNRVEDWLPSSFQETGELTWFRERFLADQFVVISWDGCWLGDPRWSGAPDDDPRIEQLAQALVSGEVERVGDPLRREVDGSAARFGHYFKSVTTARRLLNRLTSDPMNVSYPQAVTAVGFGLTRVRTSIDLMKLFDGEARILRDYRWLETNVGRLVPMEIVVRFNRSVLRAPGDTRGEYARLSLLERLEIVDEVQLAIEQRFGRPGEDVVGPSLSAVTFVPPLPERRQGTSAVIRRSVTKCGVGDAAGDPGWTVGPDLSAGSPRPSRPLAPSGARAPHHPSSFENNGCPDFYSITVRKGDERCLA